MKLNGSSLSRRDFGLLSANMAVATLISSAAGVRPAAAAGDTAVLGHFGSANPQTYAKATGAFQKVFGEKEKIDFVTVSAGSQVISAMAGGSMDICNIGSSPMVVGFGQGLKISMVYVEKIIKASECLGGRPGSRV